MAVAGLSVAVTGGPLRLRAASSYVYAVRGHGTTRGLMYAFPPQPCHDGNLSAPRSGSRPSVLLLRTRTRCYSDSVTTR
ncbi:hypothetical protein DENSPDRAFT_180839 [Dentipellis sp. KUC8613]|nr:hypothetical protein DENSPDRAFT_180839 [Dentipellis sp. KUC8613]